MALAHWSRVLVRASGCPASSGERFPLALCAFCTVWDKRGAPGMWCLVPGGLV